MSFFTGMIPLSCAHKSIFSQTAFPAAAEQSLSTLAEQVQIRRALAANRGNIAKTARQLGLSRQALYRRMEKYGIP